MNLVLKLLSSGLLTLLTVCGPFASASSAVSSTSLCRDLIDKPSKKPAQIISATYNNFDQYPQFQYEQFNHILFLSDGGKAGLALAKRKKPHQLIVSSDFRMADGVNLQIDNNKLPFRSDSFDLVLMNRGLCPCHSAIACGGIDTKKEPMKKFLSGVIDILNKNNPDSLALVTGFYFPGLFRKTVPELWLSIVEELQQEHPSLQFAILQKDARSFTVQEGFMGIAISANTAVPVSARLQQLRSNLVDSPPNGQ